MNSLSQLLDEIKDKAPKKNNDFLSIGNLIGFSDLEENEKNVLKFFETSGRFFTASMLPGGKKCWLWETGSITIKRDNVFIVEYIGGNEDCDLILLKSNNNYYLHILEKKDNKIFNNYYKIIAEDFNFII